MIEQRQSHFGRLLTICQPYWSSSDRRVAVVLVCALLGLVAVDLGTSAWLATLTKRLFDVIDARNAAGLTTLTIACVFAILFGGLYFATLEFLRQTLEFRWRKGLMIYVIAGWLGRMNSQTGYRGTNVDNPEQRIEEDIKLFVEHFLRLSIYFVISCTTFTYYSYLLWDNSPAVPIFGLPTKAYLLSVAVGFGMLNNIASHFAGRRLTTALADQQRREADLRRVLTRQRSMAAHIAANGGWSEEQRRLHGLIGGLESNWSSLKRNTFTLNFANRAFYWYGSFVPLVAAAPFVLSKALTLGTFMQSQLAFSWVAASVASFANAYQEVALWRASFRRLLAVMTSTAHAVTSELAIVHHENTHIEIANLRIRREDGATITAIDSLRIGPAEHWEICGPTGSGKSLLLNTLAGQWPYATGQISFPRDRRVMVISEKRYIPELALKAALVYPESPEAIGDEVCTDALVVVGLSQLAQRLGSTIEWMSILSSGEQVQFLMARVLVHKPAFCFFDAFSGILSADIEQSLLCIVKRRLPDMSLICTTANPSPQGVARRHYLQ